MPADQDLNGIKLRLNSAVGSAGLIPARIARVFLLLRSNQRQANDLPHDFPMGDGITWIDFDLVIQHTRLTVYSPIIGIYVPSPPRESVARWSATLTIYGTVAMSLLGVHDIAAAIE